METVTLLIGFAAATLTTIAFLPQALKCWRTKSTGDISMGMFLAMNAGVILWLTYGLLTANPPIIAANIVTICLSGSILYFKIRYG